MRIGLIAPPFIEVPPRRYGGTELFVGNLARELHARGHDVTVYANGESSLPCRMKWRYAASKWPPSDELRMQLRNADHTSWAIRDAAASVDVIHLNDAVAVPFTRFVGVPAVITVHHPHQPVLTEHYLNYPDVHYVAIAKWLARCEPMPNVHVVLHGIPYADYTYSAVKEDYAAFLGRITPVKAPHLAIAIARRAGIRLKLAGEIQPIFKDYWEQQVRPAIDGDQIEYVGEADFAIKNELLSKARALLFPIQWEEPFGLVMIESMACGTPVLAFRGGAVEEIVRDGVSGWICADESDMAARLATLDIPAEACRAYVAEHFSVSRMADQYLDIYHRAIARPVRTNAARA